MSKPVFEHQFASNPNLKLELWPDPDPISPRESENLGTMLYTTRKYILGDHRITQSSFDEYLEEAKIDPSTIVSLPLYLLDHSGLSVSTKDFGDKWDSGCVGVIFTTYDKIADEYGDVSDENIARAAEVLEQEVQEFNSYLQGDVYGFRLLEKKGDKWEEIEACWGFVGDDIQTNGVLDNLEPYLAQELKPAKASAPKFN